MTFVTLEDESGFVNLIVWERVAERFRRALFNATLLEVGGEVQKQDGVLHVIAGSLEDRSVLLTELRSRGRDFH